MGFVLDACMPISNYRLDACLPYTPPRDSGSILASHNQRISPKIATPSVSRDPKYQLGGSDIPTIAALTSISSGYSGPCN